MNAEFDRKIEPYESMNEEMRPPCHEELMAPPGRNISEM